MNKIFSEKLFYRLKKGLSEINRSLCNTGIVFKIRMAIVEKSSPEPLDIAFVISSETLKEGREIKSALENETVKKQYELTLRMFKRYFKSIKGKDKKISISMKVVEYEDILKSLDNNWYCGDIVFIEGHIYNPYYEALSLLSKF